MVTYSDGVVYSWVAVTDFLPKLLVSSLLLGISICEDDVLIETNDCLFGLGVLNRNVSWSDQVNLEHIHVAVESVEFESTQLKKKNMISIFTYKIQL